MLLKPLGPMIFRWGGSTSMLISESVSGGLYEPLPLPSTVYGLLKYALSVNELSVDSLKISGPTFYVKGESKKTALCYHAYPSKLLCVSSDEPSKLTKIEISEGEYIKLVGIHLDRRSKQAKEGYIYTYKALDMELVAREVINGSVEESGILVKVNYDGNLSKIDKFVGPLGGEGRLVKIKVLGEVKELPVYKEKKILHSPAIIEKYEDDKVCFKDQCMKVKNLVLNGDKLKLTYRLLSTGFNVNRREPMHLALMPPVEIENNVSSIGMFTEKGFGSVSPGSLLDD
ncbi:MAG: CRISPR-associated protein Cmr3 [Sulfolobaceae archaeon]|nr:CRISPR-associated protein Cmr3 [Sulfolobaceae archaeon]